MFIIELLQPWHMISRQTFLYFVEKISLPISKTQLLKWLVKKEITR